MADLEASYKPLSTEELSAFNKDMQELCIKHGVDINIESTIKVYKRVEEDAKTTITETEEGSESSSDEPIE